MTTTLLRIATRPQRQTAPRNSRFKFSLRGTSVRASQMSPRKSGGYFSQYRLSEASAAALAMSPGTMRPFSISTVTWDPSELTLT